MVEVHKSTTNPTQKAPKSKKEKIANFFKDQVIHDSKFSKFIAIFIIAIIIITISILIVIPIYYFFI